MAPTWRAMRAVALEVRAHRFVSLAYFVQVSLERFDCDAVRCGMPDLPAELLVAYAYDVIERVNPVGFLGMVLVLEGTSTAVASRAAQALGASLDLPREAFTYLSSHGALDVEHTRFFATLVDRLDDPADRALLIHCARVFYRLYADVFRGLDSARIARAHDRAAA